MSHHCVVIGGGLSGLSAAHTLLQSGCNVTLVEKNMFMGGNSTKATSGINGAGTRTQQNMDVPDNKDIFEEDTVRSATGIKTGSVPPSYELGRVLTWNSGAAVHWIQDNFGLALDTVSRLGGHSQPRTHRSKNGTTFPGMEITYKLMTAFEEIVKKSPNRANLITKAPVKKLLTDNTGRVVGVEYEKDGKRHQLQAEAVVIATGGFGAGNIMRGGILERIRPDLMHLPTTNGEHCTGDGIEFAQAIGAGAIDLEHVQVHPTGLVHLDDPDNKVKFLAAEALRGEGGIIIDRDGNRFCNDLGTRDYVTSCMWNHNKGPYRLVLNSAAVAGIAWHCKHYVGRRVMKTYANAAEIAKDMGVPVENLKKTFDDFNGYAKNQNDPWGLKFFKSAPYDIKDSFHVAVITPVIHYTMGGLSINGKAQVLNTEEQPIPGLFAAGEVTGGVHGKNRLGGSALLECVVYGREAGKSASEFVNLLAQAGSGQGGSSTGGNQGITISIPQAGGNPIVVTINGGSVSTSSSKSVPTTLPTPSVGAGLPRLAVHDHKPTTDGTTSGGSAPAAATGSTTSTTTTSATPGNKSGALGEYTLAEVSKHNKDSDCWVIVNGEVVDVTTFLADHPGGKMAIMAFAGRDATEEFNMVHEEGILQKFAANLIVGKVKPNAKL